MKIQSLLISTFAIAVLHAQDKPVDPYRETQAGDAAAHESSDPKNISICWESFSLPLATAAKLQRERLADSELYARLVAAVEKQTVRQETFTVLRVGSGQAKATVESFTEQIYPTEFETAEVPLSVGVSVPPTLAKDAPAPMTDIEKLRNAIDLTTAGGLHTPALPTSFETRNVGATLEVESTLSEDEKTVDLHIVPEEVTSAGSLSWGQGVSTAEVPVFEAQRTNCGARITVNRPYLLSTISRPPNSKVDPDAANRVWFAFITATLAKP